LGQRKDRRLIQIADPREYSLEGSYRKIIHIPSELSWRHLRYDDPEIALSQSDEDILLGEPALDLDKPDGQFAALQLSLTLGTSSYATMALRELTKQDTSAAHQTLLTAAADDQKFKGSNDNEKVEDDDDEEEEAAAAQTVQDKDIKMDEQ
jgi:tRNA pseudouridine13 synthase